MTRAQKIEAARAEWERAMEHAWSAVDSARANANGSSDVHMVQAAMERFARVVEEQKRATMKAHHNYTNAVAYAQND